MKIKYRVVEIQYYNTIKWEIQKKSIFGFWYNPLNKDAFTTGIYFSLEEAKNAINRLMYKPKSKIVYEIDNKS